MTLRSPKMAQQDAAFWLHPRGEKVKKEFWIIQFSFNLIQFFFHTFAESILFISIRFWYRFYITLKLAINWCLPKSSPVRLQVEFNMQEVRHQRPTLLPGWPTHLAWLALWLCFNFVSINGSMAWSACKLISYALRDISNWRDTWSTLLNHFKTDWALFGVVRNAEELVVSLAIYY